MYGAPPRVTAEVFASIPDSFQTGLENSAVAHRLVGRDTVKTFLEGPSFDRDGTLWFVDIPWGRIFRISPGGDVTLACQYDGEPNGLKFHSDGRIFIADHRRGLMCIDPATLQVSCILDGLEGAPFKGLNDLHFADDGALWFTDQGQTGLHDPTGRLLCLLPDGTLRRVLQTVPSPNGLVLDPTGRILYLAVTRDNAIWRVPLLPDGTIGRVGRFITMSGGVGPDGLAMNVEGGLAICHPGMGCVWIHAATGEPVLRIDSPTGNMVTNCAYGGPDNRYLYITESETGTILRAECQVPGLGVFGLSAD